MAPSQDYKLARNSLVSVPGINLEIRFDYPYGQLPLLWLRIRYFVLEMSTHDAIIIGCNPIGDESFLWRFNGSMKNSKGLHTFGGAISVVILDAIVLVWRVLPSLCVSTNSASSVKHLQAQHFFCISSTKSWKFSIRVIILIGSFC